MFSQLLYVLESIYWSWLHACVVLHCGFEVVLEDFFRVDLSLFIQVTIACTRMTALYTWIDVTPLVLEMQARIIAKVVASLQEALIVSGWRVSKSDDASEFSVI
jgi:hypothetical protein